MGPAQMRLWDPEISEESGHDTFERIDFLRAFFSDRGLSAEDA
jgi:hypothetical protein